MSEILFEIAKKYARLKKTKILDHKIYGDEIVFVLVTGPKLRMTQAELESEIKTIERAKQAELDALTKESEEAEVTKPKKAEVTKPKKGDT